MSRPNPVILLGILAAIFVVWSGVSLLGEGLYIAKHEGDTLHFIEIVLRMAEGQRPHLDFMTPIGGLAFAPVALMVKAGLGIGHAFLWSQIVVALVLLPAVWWVSLSRLSPRLAPVFGGIVLVLVLALVHGEANGAISVSMHYNRWAWAVAFIAILAAFKAPVHPNVPALDGLIIGLMVAAMVMIKVTYAAGFALPVALALWVTGQKRALAWAVLTGGAVVVALTLWLGPDYWLAYLRDLLIVSGSDIRPQPSGDFKDVVASPAYLGASLTLLAGVVFLRQARDDTGGLILLTLVPGFFFVTYQNYGNDPQWLLLLGVLLLASRPVHDLTNASGWSMRQVLGTTAAVALAMGAPSLINVAYSPFRHSLTDPAEFVPLMPRGGVHTDLHGGDVRVRRIDGRIALDGPESAYAAYLEPQAREKIADFKGETFDFCTTEIGLTSVLDMTARDLEAAGYGGTGARIFAADLLSSYWLFGDFEPIIGAAPWYYGGLPGYENVDYVVVPLCPIAHSVQADILDELEASGAAEELVEVRRTPVYILYERQRG